MMSKRNHPTNNEDRFEFLLALMTKDYENAVKVGSSVLRQNPNDLSILETLSAVKDKIVNSLAESAGDDSYEVISDEENMQTDCNTTSDSESDTESEPESEPKSETESETESDDRMTIDASKFHQNTVPVKDLSDRIKKWLFARIGKGDMEDYCFKKKIYRILAVKTNGEPTSRT
ncbi:hypothetical protein KPH14_008550 [Odynerus spinipes]|uniref:Uncharacterized protein n=1 Tax=Odynerus spinipes TaxID=1348599 RepID=A0AAD9RSV8_9HYME|nr:hypothetical protein KPH14_008550 [Odynerus spinipes]